MSDFQPDFKEAYDLISRYVDGELSLGESERLLELLRQNPELDRVLYENLHTDFLIRQSSLSDKAQASVPFWSSPGYEGLTEASEPGFFEEIIQYEKNAPSLLPPPSFQTEEPTSFWESVRQIKRPRWLPSVRSLVACLVLFLFIGTVIESVRMLWHSSQTHWEPIARIVETVDAQWDASHDRFKVGEELGPDKLFLKSGVVQVEFVSGAKVTLEGPTIFVLKGRNQSFCQIGKLSAEVPPSAKGFEVATPFSTVVDLGTEFSLEITETSAEVHVIRGVVEVNRSASSILRLVDGVAARLTYKGETEKKEADRKRFLSSAKVQEQASQFRHEVGKEQEQIHQKIETDPALVYSLRHRKKSSYRTEIVGCRPVPGYLPGETVLQLNHPGDRVALTIPEKFENLTLVASIQLDQITNSGTVLCLCRSFYETPNTFLWQISRFGDVQFHLRTETGLETYDATQLITRKDWKTRMVLCVVLDSAAGEIRHYKDGQRILCLPWDMVEPVQLGEIALGNEFFNRKKYTSRRLHGCLEDIVLFSRVLSDQEIAELFHR